MNPELPTTVALHGTSTGFEPVLNSPGLNALFSEIVLGGHFGDLGMICAVRQDHWTAYLPDASLARLADEGHRDSGDATFVERYLADAHALTASLKGLVSSHVPHQDWPLARLVDGLRAVARWYASFLQGYGQADFFRFTRADEELRAFSTDETLLRQLLTDGPLPPGLPPRIAQLARLMRDVQMVKWVLRGSYNEAYVRLFVPLTAAVAGRTGRPDVECLTFEELETLVAGGAVPDASLRRQWLVAERRADRYAIDTGDAARRRVLELEGAPPAAELRGMVASGGRVEGVVRVIPVTPDVERYLDRMQKGEVLVAATTGPEMMVAIQRACAIVTDEGGLMSHAAVVSRELRIPCVVGTRYATRTLRDGDRVLVDAQEGVVQRLGA